MLPHLKRDANSGPQPQDTLQKIPTSATNHWCGFFALANCLKYQPKEIRHDAYRAIDHSYDSDDLSLVTSGALFSPVATNALQNKNASNSTKISAKEYYYKLRQIFDKAQNVIETAESEVKSIESRQKENFSLEILGVLKEAQQEERKKIEENFGKNEEDRVLSIETRLLGSGDNMGAIRHQALEALKKRFESATPSGKASQVEQYKKGQIQKETGFKYEDLESFVGQIKHIEDAKRIPKSLSGVYIESLSDSNPPITSKDIFDFLDSSGYPEGDDGKLKPNYYQEFIGGLLREKYKGGWKEEFLEKNKDFFTGSVIREEGVDKDENISINAVKFIASKLNFEVIHIFDINRGPTPSEGGKANLYIQNPHVGHFTSYVEQSLIDKFEQELQQNSQASAFSTPAKVTSSNGGGLQKVKQWSPASQKDEVAQLCRNFQEHINSDYFEILKILKAQEDEQSPGQPFGTIPLQDRLRLSLNGDGKKCVHLIADSSQLVQEELILNLDEKKFVKFDNQALQDKSQKSGFPQEIKNEVEIARACQKFQEAYHELPKIDIKFDQLVPATAPVPAQTALSPAESGPDSSFHTAYNPTPNQTPKPSLKKASGSPLSQLELGKEVGHA